MKVWGRWVEVGEWLLGRRCYGWGPCRTLKGHFFYRAGPPRACGAASPNTLMLAAFCHSSAPVSFDTTEMKTGVCLMVSWSRSPHCRSSARLRVTNCVQEEGGTEGEIRQGRATGLSNRSCGQRGARLLSGRATK